MSETVLSDAVLQLQITAVETLTRLLKTETDPAELRRLLTIAVRVRHPAAERRPRASNPVRSGEADSPAAGAPQAPPEPASNPQSHRRPVTPKRDDRAENSVTPALPAPPDPARSSPQSISSAPQALPLSARRS